MKNLTRKILTGAVLGAIVLGGGCKGSLERGRLLGRVEQVADKNKDGHTSSKEWKSVYDSFGKGDMFIKKCSDPYAGMNHKGQYLSVDEMKEYLANN